MIYDGPPSCDDVNNNYALLSEAADASSSGYYRCEGCGDYGDIVNWDITELELNGQNGWGHYTIYSRSFFFFFLPFSSSSSSSLNSYKPTAGDGNSENVEISSVFFSCFLFLFFYTFYLFLLPFLLTLFFLLLQRTPDTKSLRPMAAPSAGAVL